MKVAVCVSGICRGNVSKYLNLMKMHFPYDFFYASWQGRENEVKKHASSIYDQVRFYPEPNMHYHPILDVEDVLSPKLNTIKKKMQSGQMGLDYRERTLHHTKQILIHSYLLKDLPRKYDMIIRTRFDTMLSMSLKFDSYLKKSYEENIAIGFGTRTTRHPNMNVFKEIPKIYPDGKNEKVSNDWGWYLMDPLIFHPRKLFNNRTVNSLHKQKKLLVAENGWYQVLSQPYNDSHLSVYGGAQIEKYLR